MRLIKPDNYLPSELYLSKIADAMSHPFRRKILEMLLNSEISTRSELLNYSKLSKVAIYNHVRILINADLIECIYHIHFEELRLNYSALAEMKNYMDEMLSKYQ